MDFEEWVKIGTANGWCSELYCYTHGTVELTDEEVQEFDDGHDPCIWCVRIR